MWRNDSRLTQKEKGCKVGKKEEEGHRWNECSSNGFTVSTLAKRGITGTSLAWVREVRAAEWHSTTFSKWSQCEIVEENQRVEGRRSVGRNKPASLPPSLPILPLFSSL